jgi:hypothetical protein
VSPHHATDARVDTSIGFADAARAVLAAREGDARRERAAAALAAAVEAAGPVEPEFGYRVTCEECAYARTFAASTARAIAEVDRLGCPRCGAHWHRPRERTEPEPLAPLVGPGRRVVLIACSDQKARGKGRLPAAELYVSPLFQKSLAYARTLVRDSDIRVLSALHGVVRLEERFAPYDWKLDQLSLREREQWGNLVAARLVGDFGRGLVEATVLAGTAYVDALRGGLAWWRADWQLVLPFGDAPGQRLCVGQRLRWLNQRNNRPHAVLARWLNRSPSATKARARSAA